MAYYTESELKALNFKSVGSNVRLSKLASFYGCEYIELGDNCRVDDFCIISSGKEGIVIGKYVHIACFSLLIGKARIEMKDFSGLSSRVSVYSSSDDYSGNYLTNPTVPEEFTNVYHKPVLIGEHVIVGSNTTILPGVTLGDGSAIGAHSLVKNDILPGKIAHGVPAKIYSDRGDRIFELAEKVKKK